MTDVFKEMADRLEIVAAEARVKWINTLAVGNGAALFAALSLGMKDGVLAFPQATLIAAWLFLLGVVSASFAHLCSAALFHHLLMYWRWSSVERTYKDLDDRAELAALQPDIEQADKHSDASEAAMGWASAISSLSFILGVGIPLGLLTARYLSG